MAEEWTVTEVRLVRRTMPGAKVVREQWVVGLRRPDGAEGNHIIPAEAFAGRAAEYWSEDEDPPTVAELLDMILHEPYIPAEHLPVHTTEETVLVATADGVTEPQARIAAAPKRVTAHSARSHADARHAHLARIEAAKEHVRIAPPKSAAGRTAAGLPEASKVADPLDAIRERVTIDPGHVAEMRRMVALAHEHNAQDRERRAVPLGAERLPTDGLREKQPTTKSDKDQIRPGWSHER